MINVMMASIMVDPTMGLVCYEFMADNVAIIGWLFVEHRYRCYLQP